MDRRRSIPICACARARRWPAACCAASHALPAAHCLPPTSMRHTASMPSSAYSSTSTCKRKRKRMGGRCNGNHAWAARGCDMGLGVPLGHAICHIITSRYLLIHPEVIERWSGWQHPAGPLDVEGDGWPTTQAFVPDWRSLTGHDSCMTHVDVVAVTGEPHRSHLFDAVLCQDGGGPTCSGRGGRGRVRSGQVRLGQTVGLFHIHR